MVDILKTFVTIDDAQIKDKVMKKPNLLVEQFLSMLKIFLIFVILNNLIWAGVFFGYVDRSFGGSYDIAMTQDGENNNQSLTNGAAENKDKN